MSSLHLYLDSADIAELRACLPHPLVHGVTTNPTLLKRAGVARSALPALVDELLALGARQVQAQVHAADVDGMLADAEVLLRMAGAGQMVVKIPATREGLRAGAQLSARGVPVTYTAVYAPEQAAFAAMLGAAYAAPYLGRLQDSGADGLAVIGQMQALIERVGQARRADAGLAHPHSHGAATRLLVASVRTREAFLGLLSLGVGAITLPPRLLPELLDHAATLQAERGFLADAAAL